MKKSKYLLFFSMMFILAGFVSLSFYDKGSVLNNLWQTNYIILCCKAFNTPILNVTAGTYMLYALLSLVILVASAICSYFGARGKKHLLYCSIINVLVIFLCNVNSFRAADSAVFFIGGVATTLILAVELAIMRIVIGVLFKPEPLKNSVFENTIMALIVARFGAFAVYLYDKTMTRPQVINKYNFVQMYYSKVSKAEILNITSSAYVVTAIVALVVLVSFVLVKHFTQKKQNSTKALANLIYTLVVVVFLIVMALVSNAETGMAIKVFVVWGVALTLVYALALFFLRCICQILFGQLNILTADNCSSVAKNEEAAEEETEEETAEETEEPAEEETEEAAEEETEEETAEETEEAAEEETAEVAEEETEEVAEEETEEETEEAAEEETEEETEEPAEEETEEETEEPVEEETESEEDEESDEEDDSDDDDENGPVFTTEERVSKSVKAKMILASDDVKNQYDAILNQVNKYKKYSTRFSWSVLSVNIGRTKAMKINMSGKRMCVYFALDPEKYPEGNKYHLKNYGDKKKYESTPMRLRLSSQRALKYALELIDEVFTTNEIALKKVEPEHVDYKADLAPMTEEELAVAGLIKYRQVQVEVAQENAELAAAEDSKTEEKNNN